MKVQNRINIVNMKDILKRPFNLFVVISILAILGYSCSEEDNNLLDPVNPNTESSIICVSVDATEGGLVKINGEDNEEVYLNKGDKIVLTATPDEDYFFLNWTLDGVEVSKDIEYTPEVSKDAKYVANFAKSKISITLKTNKEKAATLTMNRNAMNRLQDSTLVVDYNAKVTIDVNRQQSAYNFVFYIIDGEIVSMEKKYEIENATKDTEVYVVFSDLQKEQNQECRDMGLSVKWATCNLGAAKPHNYGNYYAWGETESKQSYDNLSYKWWSADTESYTKYFVDSELGEGDNKKVLDGEDDAASALWGGAWRMPTTEEWNELKSECEWIWSEVEGVKGYIVISKNKDNYIFIPAAGYYFEETAHFAEAGGYYWANSLKSGSSVDAGYLYFYSDKLMYGYHERYAGQSIRAVVAQ